MKTPIIEPYLYFGGRCEEALAFYGEALRAEVKVVMRFSESPEPLPPGMIKPGWEEKIMHAVFQIGESVIMASDGCGEAATFGGFSLALSLANEDAVNQTFAALEPGGEVTMPLAQTFWSARFGMLKDRFGLGWSVGVASSI